MNDLFIFNERKFSLIAFSEDEPYHPARHGLNPVGSCTACWRGYICTYGTITKYLCLKRLEVNLYNAKAGDRYVRIQGPPVNGVESYEPDSDHSLFNHVYEGIGLRLDYSGGMLIGNDFIWDLYVHMGFHPAWKYKEVYELIFNEGLLTDVFDRSQAMADLRQRITEQQADAENEFPYDDLEQWIEACFSRKYNRGMI